MFAKKSPKTPKYRKKLILSKIDKEEKEVELEKNPLEKLQEEIKLAYDVPPMVQIG